MIAEKALPRSPPRAFDHISYSFGQHISGRARLRLVFRYVLGLPERTISSSLVLGSALHRAVQHHFEQLMVGRSGTDLDTLLAVFQDAWESYDDQIIRYGVGESRDEIGRMAERLLTEFLEE